MTWAWAMLIAVLMVPPTVTEEAEQRDDLPTARATSVYRLSATGEELW